VSNTCTVRTANVPFRVLDQNIELLCKIYIPKPALCDCSELGLEVLSSLILWAFIPHGELKVKLLIVERLHEQLILVEPEALDLILLVSFHALDINYKMHIFNVITPSRKARCLIALLAGSQFNDCYHC
jgi:hypothetical protein